MAYNDVIRDILETNDNIGFLTICDMDGNISGAGHYEGTKNLLSYNESIVLQKLALKSWGARNLFSSKIGQGKCAIVIFEKIRGLTISFGKDHLLYMIIDVDTDHEKIIDSVIKLEKKYLKA